ncbi:hypothetical protein FIBSPDRAFT_885025 [Athelia psychrophila]|uniref:Uncharacterized protein n=1 Tax=Athelia psychrophila TaxID=1759441 RepID=A0A166SB64_9AGAM|nr:hypothetical protein FIBSPDRAFT_885025 [Fibularhizoctonia sp. CBS 109695]
MYKHPAELQFTPLFAFHSQPFLFNVFALSPVGAFGPAEQLRDSSIGVGLPVDLSLPRLLLQRWSRVSVGFMGFYWLIVRRVMPVVTFLILWALGALITYALMAAVSLGPGGYGHVRFKGYCQFRARATGLWDIRVSVIRLPTAVRLAIITIVVNGQCYAEAAWGGPLRVVTLQCVSTAMDSPSIQPLRKKKASVKPPTGWHRPFMGFLEPRQHLWDALEDDPAKLAFLEDSRTALEEWTVTEVPRATIPEHCVLKSYLAGYHTSCQPRQGHSKTGKKKELGPSRIKSRYTSRDIIKSMFDDRVSKETAWLYQDDNRSKPKFLYAGAVLNNVEKSLSSREMLSVATLKERWDTGLGITPHQKCMHNEAKLASRATEFLLEIKRKFDAQVFIQVGFPDRCGDLNVTSFETIPPEPHKKFSKSSGWKESGKFEAFDGWVSKVYANDNSAPDDEPALGGSQDLVYKVPVEFADMETPDDAGTIPMLMAFSQAWPLARMRPGWRSYVTQVWHFQTGRITGAPPWSKLANNTDGIVTLADGVYVNWTDPSRMSQQEMVKTWKSVVLYQNKSAGQKGGFEFPFVEKCKRAAKVAAAAMGSVSDNEDDGDGDDEQEEEEDELEEEEDHAKTLPAKHKMGLAKTSRGRRVKSKEMVESGAESSGDEPPAKKAKIAKKAKSVKGKEPASSASSDPDLEAITKQYAGGSGSDEQYSKEPSKESDVVTIKSTAQTSKAPPAKRSKPGPSKQPTTPAAGTSSPAEPAAPALPKKKKGSDTKSSRKVAADDVPANEPHVSASAAAKSLRSATIEEPSAPNDSLSPRPDPLPGHARPKQVKASKPTPAAPGARPTAKKRAPPAKRLPSGSISLSNHSEGSQLGTATTGASGAADTGASGAADTSTSGASGAADTGASGAATADSSGAADTGASGAANTAASGAAPLEMLSPAGWCARRAAGMGPNPVALTGDWAEDESILSTYDIGQLDDDICWIPDEDTPHPVPDNGSPAAAFAGSTQIEFLRQLSVEPSYLDMLPFADMHCIEFGAFKAEVPWFLRWWYPLKAGPAVLRTMDLDAFRPLVDSLLHGPTTSGFIHHSSLLAVGLLFREVRLAHRDRDAGASADVLNTDHYNYLLQQVHTARGKVVGMAEETYAIFPPIEPEKNGFVFDRDFMSAFQAQVEPGSPLEAVNGTRATALAYLKSLSSAEAYQHAVASLWKYKIEQGPWCEGMVPSLSWARPTYYAGGQIHQSSGTLRTIITAMSQSARDGLPDKGIRHPYVLAFGLALRDIAAAVDTASGKVTDPAFWMVSDLGAEDFDFVLSELKDLLKQYGHPAYAVKEGRNTRARTAIV